MKPPKAILMQAILSIVSFYHLSCAISLGISASNYGGPSLGFSIDCWKTSTYVDFLYSTKMEDIPTSPVSSIWYLVYQEKTDRFGVRINPNYSMKTGLADIQIGPVLGADRYWFNTFTQTGPGPVTVTSDSTILYDQYCLGLYIGARVTLVKQLSLVIGSSLGYLSGETLKGYYYAKKRFYKFDVIENKIGLNMAF